ncbi:MAG: hypothetical protein ACRDAU_05165 [Clostridium sp.]
MNKSIDLTLTLLKRSGYETRLFVCISALVSALIFNFTNLTLSSKLSTVPPVVNYTLTSFLIIILGMAFFVTFKANEYLNEVNSKEIGIKALSGISNFSLGFLLTIQISILNFLGYFLGIILGVIISPLFNLFIFKSFSIDLNLNAFIYMALFCILQSFVLGLINQGFGYRNDITVLLGLNDKAQFLSKRYDKKLKLKSYLSIPLMLSIILILFIPKDIVDSLGELILLVIYLPVIAAGIFFKSFIPLFLDNLKAKKYLNHKYFLIISNNLKTSLAKMFVVFSNFILIGVMFPTFMLMLESNHIINLFSSLSFIITIFLMTFLMIFTSLSSNFSEMKSLKSLIPLGYSKADLIYIMKTKILIFYFILTSIPLLFTTTLAVYLILYQGYSISLAIMYLCTYILIFIVSSVVTYLSSLRQLNSILD